MTELGSTMLIDEVWSSLATTHGLMLQPVTPGDDPAADVATIAAGLGVEYRLIGGIAITLLVHHHQVDHLVPSCAS